MFPLQDNNAQCKFCISTNYNVTLMGKNHSWKFLLLELLYAARKSLFSSRNFFHRSQNVIHNKIFKSYWLSTETFHLFNTRICLSTAQVNEPATVKSVHIQSTGSSIEYQLEITICVSEFIWNEDVTD